MLTSKECILATFQLRFRGPSSTRTAIIPTNSSNDSSSSKRCNADTHYHRAATSRLQLTKRQRAARSNKNLCNTPDWTGSFCLLCFKLNSGPWLKTLRSKNNVGLTFDRVLQFYRAFLRCLFHNLQKMHFLNSDKLRIFPIFYLIAYFFQLY